MQGYIGFRVEVPNNLVLGALVIVTVVHVLRKYMIIRYLEHQGNLYLSRCFQVAAT